MHSASHESVIIFYIICFSILKKQHSIKLENSSFIGQQQQRGHMTESGLLAAFVYTPVICRSLLMEKQQQPPCWGPELLSFSQRGAAVAAGRPSPVQSLDWTGPQRHTSV